MSQRTLAWFSCGDASAVAAALALKKDSRNTEIVRIIVPDEHEDGHRFAADCARWYGVQIIELQDPQKRSAEDVWRQRRYFSGIKGAPCTGELKKAVRFAYQRPDDIHVMGYTYDEMKRADKFTKNNPEIYCDFPLIRHRLKKDDCHAIVRARGIEMHAMYALGFENANCKGCCKGGKGYWNRTREVFPLVFKSRVELTREIGARPLVQDGERIYLDELRPGTGRLRGPVFECSAFCEPVEEMLA